MPVHTATLTELFAELDRYRERVPLDELVEKMRAIEITFDDVRQFAQFGPETYRRNLMHQGPGYQALVLCWRAGQRSPIHDHRGSSCGVRVLKGVCTETVFERTPEGYVYPTETHQLQEGHICGSQDSDLHQISNLQAQGRDLVTLHIYSPPLLTMGVYSIMDTSVREFFDPIVGLTHGDGI